ncbi:hypothetical protein BMS3Abin03_00308 [bacterium BMS3Abin03]|nr:hypothetical protein BMS3Abin03_00308 [bacterium BMS3Abin03]
MKSRLIFSLILLINLPVLAQYNGKDFSLTVYGIYTTSASIFLNPNAADIVLRNKSFDIENIFNPGIDVRFRVSEPLILGVSTEYVKTTKTAPNLDAFIGGDVVTLDVEDGFRMIPIEFTAYYIIPFSTEEFKFLMGGGVGYYYGDFIRKIGDAEVITISHDNSIGIHVLTSVDYVPLNYLAIRFQMKFRDPQFTVTSRYNREEVEYTGQPISLPQEPFETKINMDGITFMLGVVFQF